MAQTKEQLEQELARLKSEKEQLEQEFILLKEENVALQNEVADLKALVAKQDEILKQPAMSVSQHENIEDLKLQLEEAKSQKAEADAHLEEALALIAEQQKELSADSGSTGDEIITVDGQKYRLTAPKFSFKGAEIDAKALRDMPEIAKHLVKVQSSILQAI